jgi:hypothetical protein
VIIGLDELSREKAGEMPFKSVFLNWDLGPCPFSEEDPDADARLEEMYRLLAAKLQDLMDTLRGPDVE